MFWNIEFHSQIVWCGQRAQNNAIAMNRELRIGLLPMTMTMIMAIIRTLNKFY